MLIKTTATFKCLDPHDNYQVQTASLQSPQNLTKKINRIVNQNKVFNKGLNQSMSLQN